MRIQICANKYSHKYKTTSNQDEYLVIIDTAETPPYSMATSYPVSPIQRSDRMVWVFPVCLDPADTPRSTYTAVCDIKVRSAAWKLHFHNWNRFLDVGCQKFLLGRKPKNNHTHTHTHCNNSCCMDFCEEMCSSWYKSVWQSTALCLEAQALS